MLVRTKNGFQGARGACPSNRAGKSRWRWHLLQKRWPHMAERLTPRDLRAVTSLIWEHVINPCGVSARYERETQLDLIQWPLVMTLYPETGRWEF